MKKILMVLLIVGFGLTIGAGVIRAQVLPSSSSGADPSTLLTIQNFLNCFARGFSASGCSGASGNSQVEPAPIDTTQTYPGYQVTSNTTGDLNTLTGAIIRGNHGGVGDSNLTVFYPGGGQLTGTEFSALAHRDGFWSAMYANAGQATGNRAIYAKGSVTLMGNVGIGIESPFSQDKLHVAGNIRADNTIVASKGICVGGEGEFRCTNDGNQSGTWCGFYNYPNSFPCKGVPMPGCPTGYAYTQFNLGLSNLSTCIKQGTGYP